ncbi:hypothetical protein D3C76_1632160 [compost metagenome]
MLRLIGVVSSRVAQAGAAPRRRRINQGALATLAGGVQITSLMLSGLGISFSAWNVSAIFCCAATTSGVSGAAP